MPLDVPDEIGPPALEQVENGVDLTASAVSSYSTGGAV
jgi:hypothetical protein